MPETGPPEGAMHIINALRGRGHRALLAGGCVRDRAMGRAPADWDIASGADPGEVAHLFERTEAVGAKFGVVLVILPDGEYEVAQFRTEEAYLDGRHPSAVHPAGEEEDARRRDFSINGMFLDPVEGKIIDYVGGQEDIDRRLIRAIGDPARRFEEDHLRLLRAVRFAARFGYAIEEETLAAVKKFAPRIRRTSAERVHAELTAMLTGPHPERAFELLRETGLLREVLPEAAEMEGVEQPPQFHPEGDVWTHVMMVLAQLRDPGPALAWATLLHDVGKPATFAVTDRIRFNGHSAAGARISEEICERLKMPGETADRIRDIVRDHMKFMNVRKMRESTLKRFLREPHFSELQELHRIDCLASHGNLATRDFCLEKLAGITEEDLRPARILNGHDLAAMGFEPGPPFGEILRAVEDEQLEGRVRTREAAEAFVNERFGALRSG